MNSSAAIWRREHTPRAPREGPSRRGRGPLRWGEWQVRASSPTAPRPVAAWPRSSPSWALDPLILGLARGGVPVAAEVAAALGADLDVLVVRKVGHPAQPEYALGAVSEDGVVAPDGLSPDLVAPQLQRARAQALALRGDRPRIPLEGRTAVVVDDGLATGRSMAVALRDRGSPRRRPRPHGRARRLGAGAARDRGALGGPRGAGGRAARLLRRRPVLRGLRAGLRRGGRARAGPVCGAWARPIDGLASPPPPGGEAHDGRSDGAEVRSSAPSALRPALPARPRPPRRARSRSSSGREVLDLGERAVGRLDRDRGGRRAR